MLGLLCLGLAGAAAGLVHARSAAERTDRAEAAALAERDGKEKARQAESAGRAAVQQQQDAARAAREGLPRTLYGSNLNLLQAAWEVNNTTRVLELPDDTRPGEEDMRRLRVALLGPPLPRRTANRKLDFGRPRPPALDEGAALSPLAPAPGERRWG
jgi:hypothetical protein